MKERSHSNVTLVITHSFSAKRDINTHVASVMLMKKKSHSNVIIPALKRLHLFMKEKNPLKCDICDYSRYQKTNMNRHVEDINKENKETITVTGQNITCIIFSIFIFHFPFNVLCIYTRSNLIYTFTNHSNI